MDRIFMEQYFEMAYEDFCCILMRENRDFTKAQKALRKSIKELLEPNESGPIHPLYQHYPKEYFFLYIELLVPHQVYHVILRKSLD